MPGHDDEGGEQLTEAHAWATQIPSPPNAIPEHPRGREGNRGRRNARRAGQGVQRADRLPSVGVGAAAARAANGNGDAYTVGFAVSAFELDLFGRVKALSNAALARYLASDEGRRAAQMTLIAAVANAELTLRADDEQLQVTRSTLASREEVLRLVRVRFEGGVAAEPELRAAESLLAGARATLAALQRQRQQDLNALVLLLGQPLPADLPPAPPLNAFTLAELPVGLPSEVLLQRPDIRAAEQQLMAANANIGAARAAFFPRITLTASAGTASTQLSGLFENTAWAFTGNLLQPLFVCFALLLRGVAGPHQTLFVGTPGAHTELAFLNHVQIGVVAELDRPVGRRHRGHVRDPQRGPAEVLVLSLIHISEPTRPY